MTIKQYRNGNPIIVATNLEVSDSITAEEIYTRLNVPVTVAVNVNGVSVYGSAHSSTDLVTWTQSALPSETPTFWNKVVYGNGKFVAASYKNSAAQVPTAAHSTDGITWTASTLPYSGLEGQSGIGLTYGADKFVIVAHYSTEAVYSTDGVAWTATTMPSDATWLALAHGNGKFAAISFYPTVAAHSTDGITWVSNTISGINSIRSMVYGSDKFVAVGWSLQGAYSTDGITWTVTTMPSWENFQSVTYGNGKFVAVANFASEGAVAYSTDGITWTGSSALSSGFWWRDVSYVNGKFLAMGVGDTAAYSTDAITWTTITMPFTTPFTTQWRAATYGDVLKMAKINDFV